MTIINEKSVIKSVSLGDINNIAQLYYDLNKKIKCNYLTYMIELGDKKFYFSSSQSWQEIF